MGLPAGAQTVVLTGHVGLVDGQATRDTITLTPSVPEAVSASLNYVATDDPITIIPNRLTGLFSIRLLATDAAGFSPSGWTYSVARGSRTPYFINLPAGTPTVDLADLTPVSEDPGTYELVVPLSSLGAAALLDVGQVAGTVAAGDDPRFSSGGLTPASTVATETAFGQASAVGTGTAYARSDHTHGTPAAQTKSSLGLGGVDNTSDTAKPVSTATATALSAKADLVAGVVPNTQLPAYDPAGAASAVGSALTSHAAATTGVHGIADTSALVTTADSRLTNSRAPSGTAGGDLSGTYPSPTVAKVGGVSVSGTPSTGWVPTATSGTTSAWQALPAAPSAASTVAGETAYGQASAVGTGTAYARSDHTHGTPGLTGSAPAVTEGIGTAAAVGTATSPARADHVHPMAAAAAPAGSAVGDAVATGAAATFAASDHVHAREAFGAVTAQTSFAAASGNGAAATVARSDHAHGTPTLPAASTSVSGVVQLDGTAGDIQPLGAQAAGAVGKAADAGHVHAMPRLDQVGTPTVAVGLGSQKITSLANGVGPQDGAAFGQIPVGGTGATNFAVGNDSRLSNARTPTAHASTHAAGGSDPITAASISALDLAGGTLTGALTLSSGGVASRTPDIQVFTVGGTWTKPAGAVLVVPYLISGGGGGGSGRRGAVSTVRCAGGGGAGGSVYQATLQASALPGTVAVTVGAGGPGGASRTTDDTDGAAGTAGAATTFGTIGRVGTSGAGAGGTATAGAGGSSGAGTAAGGGGGAASATGAAGNSGGAGVLGGPGGGSGGGITSGNAAAAGTGGGGNGGSISGAGGSVGGAAPSPAADSAAGSGLSGGGGGGGAASITAAATAGAAGALYGAGGGGGGASLNGNNSGAGGSGANGMAVIYTYF